MNTDTNNGETVQLLYEHPQKVNKNHLQLPSVPRKNHYATTSAPS